MELSTWSMATEVVDGEMFVRWTLVDGAGRTVADVANRPRDVLATWRAAVEHCVAAVQLEDILLAFIASGMDPVDADKLVSAALPRPLVARPLET